MSTSTPSRDRTAGLDEPTQLFHAHLEVMVHLMRDELRWAGEEPSVSVRGEPGRSSGDDGSATDASPQDHNAGHDGSGRWASSRMVQLLHRERRHLLRRQDGSLAREARFRLLGDRLVSRLESEVGVDPKDAAVVVWFFRTEVASRPPESDRPAEGSTGAIMHRVGDAHARLLEGSDPFLPVPSRRLPAGFPLAVAVAATRLARRNRRQTTWMDVEPIAMQILRVVLGPRAHGGVAS